jgi:VanZ family protein
MMSAASGAELSAPRTSRFLEPLLRWLFPGITGVHLEQAHILVRKLGHLTEYAILAWLAARALVSSSRALLRGSWFRIALLLIICYALLDEYHQSFVPLRTPSIYDSFIDMIGGFAALLVFARYQRKRRPAKTDPGA